MRFPRIWFTSALRAVAPSAAAALLTAMIAACAAGTGSLTRTQSVRSTPTPSAPTHTPTTPTPTLPTITPTLTTSPSVAPSVGPNGIIVTFRVQHEEFRAQVTDPGNIEIAFDLLAKRPGPSIPNAIVIRAQTSVNIGWSWHMDPATFEWAEVTIEVCDGLPSDVERATITSDRFCPWAAEVVAIAPAP